MTNKSKSTKSTYTREFKENAIRLTLFGEKSRAAVARELGIPDWKLRDWVRTAEKGMPQDGSGKSPLDELAALKKENKTLRSEVEILKKASAYFAKNLS
jgi:transposase